MDWTVTTYMGYLAIAVPLTIWVARTLFTNGTVFLADVFEGRTDLSRAVNHLLVVGFYLLNVGFVLLFLRLGEPVVAASEMFETLSVKLGVVMLVLGAVHFANIVVFNSIRKRHQWERATSAPIQPNHLTVPNAVPSAMAPTGHPAPGH